MTCGPAAVFLTTVVFFLASVRGAYPTTYPFENEATTVPGLKAATPDDSYGEDDPGGYLYSRMFMFDVTEDLFIAGPQISWCWVMTEAFAFFFVNTLQMDASFPNDNVPFWNCTNLWSAADYTGLVNTERVCQADLCCAEMIGKPQFAEDSMQWHTHWDSQAAGNGCTETPPEHVYCLLVGGDTQIDCLQYNIDPDTRLVVYPCYDTFYLWFMSCALYTQGSFTHKFDIEPASYISSCSVDEVLAEGGIHHQPDRVCKPNSYFNPTDTRSTQSDSGTVSSESSIPEMGLLLFVGALM